MENLPLPEEEYQNWVAWELQAGELIELLQTRGVPDDTLAWVMAADRESGRRAVRRAARLVEVRDLLQVVAERELRAGEGSPALELWDHLLQAGSRPRAALQVAQWGRRFALQPGSALREFLTSAALKELPKTQVLPALHAVVSHDPSDEALEIALKLVVDGTPAEVAFASADALAK